MKNYEVLIIGAYLDFIAELGVHGFVVMRGDIPKYMYLLKIENTSKSERQLRQLFRVLEARYGCTLNYILFEQY